MKYLHLCWVLMPLLAGCAGIHVDNSTTKRTEIPIIEYMKIGFSDYAYETYYVYPEKELGCRIRFINRTNIDDYADVYVYPVLKEAKQYSHKEIVLWMAEQSNHDVYLAEERGIYQNVELLSREVFDKHGTIVAKYKYTFMKENLQVLSFLYLTEHQDNFLKVRVTMPDNKANSTSHHVDDFVSDIFEKILTKSRKTLQGER